MSAGWNRTWRQRGGTRRVSSRPSLLFTFQKAMDAEVSVSPNVASISSLPSPFLPYSLHPRSHEGLANTFNVLCPLLKEGTGQGSGSPTSLAPQNIVVVKSIDNPKVSPKGNSREERRELCRWHCLQPEVALRPPTSLCSAGHCGPHGPHQDLGFAPRAGNSGHSRDNISLPPPETSSSCWVFRLGDEFPMNRDSEKGG